MYDYLYIYGALPLLLVPNYPIYPSVCNIPVPFHVFVQLGMPRIRNREIINL